MARLSTVSPSRTLGVGRNEGGAWLLLELHLKLPAKGLRNLLQRRESRIALSWLFPTRVGAWGDAQQPGRLGLTEPGFLASFPNQERHSHLRARTNPLPAPAFWQG